jgi:hypothetical protein
LKQNYLQKAGVMQLLVLGTQVRPSLVTWNTEGYFTYQANIIVVFVSENKTLII